jgi:hypothetical protein
MDIKAFGELLKSFSDVLKFIPSEFRFAALGLVLLVVLTLAVLQSNIFNLLGKRTREAITVFIIRYVFIGVGAICVASFGYAIVTGKSQAVELGESIK